MPFSTDQGIIKLITYVAIVREGQVLLVQYDRPPNPEKTGWWIPAPELEYGQEPQARVALVLQQLGIPEAQAELVETESFVVGTAWHLILHYRAVVTGDVQPGEGIRSCQWFDAANLPEAGAFAHGKWEQRLALKHLQTAAHVTS